MSLYSACVYRGTRRIKPIYAIKYGVEDEVKFYNAYINLVILAAAEELSCTI